MLHKSIMVYRLKRKLRLKRKTFKRRPFNMTRRKIPKTGFFKVLRWSSAASANCHIEIGGNDALPSTDGTTNFSLANLNGYGELVSLFDNFRIVRILYRWVITRTPDTVTAAGNKGIFPRICWCHDFNDSSVITRNAIYQRGNMKEVFMSENYQKTRWYSLKPSSLVQLYESPTATAYSPKWLQWLDTSDSNTPHYGIKYNIDQNYSGMIVRLEAKVVVECKGIS